MDADESILGQRVDTLVAQLGIGRAFLLKHISKQLASAGPAHGESKHEKMHQLTLNTLESIEMMLSAGILPHEILASMS